MDKLIINLTERFCRYYKYIFDINTYNKLIYQIRSNYQVTARFLTNQTFIKSSDFANITNSLSNILF